MTGFTLPTQPLYAVGQRLSFMMGAYELDVLSPAEIDAACLDYWKAVSNKHQMILKDLSYETRLHIRSPTGMVLMTYATVAELIRH